MRAALVLLVVASIDLPGLTLQNPPTTLNQVHQALRIEQELAHLAPGSVTQPSLAVLNLYGNYTFTQIPPPMSFQNFIVGVRVQVRSGKLFYAPVPAEVAGWLTSAPNRYRDEFALPAAHILVFMTDTLKRHPVPDVDVTFSIADFCFGIARSEPERWGLGAAPLTPPNEAPPALTSTKIPPVFAWNSARTGRRTCNAVTTTSYDWNLPNSMPGIYEGAVPWAQRKPILGWRGSLIGNMRARLVRFALGRDDMDIKIAGGFMCGKYVQDAAAFGATDADCEGEKKVTSTFVELTDQEKWKFVIDVDGGASTWRMKSLLLGGWCIFKIDSPEQQFWYEQLVPFVHYIPIDAERLEIDLPAKLKWAIEHDDEVMAMAVNARAFAAQHLTLDTLHWQQYASLALYAAKLAPVQPDAALSRWCCKDLSPWPYLEATCKDEGTECAAEPARAGFVREDWKAWGSVQPTAFPQWYSIPTEGPVMMTAPPSFLRGR